VHTSLRGNTDIDRRWQATQIVVCMQPVQCDSVARAQHAHLLPSNKATNKCALVWFHWLA
jgi:hypothetical protein